MVANPINIPENLLNPTEKKKSSEGMHDMVIAFDSTGSMSAYLDSVKEHVTTLIPELLKTNPNIRIGIVVFGDYCDMESSTVFGKAYQVLPLTSDEKTLIKFVKNSRRTGGGDGDEFYELVIKKIVEETPWRESARKSVLLIADASPHKVGYSYGQIVHNSQIDWKVEAFKAKEKNIQFDTLSITTAPWYQELSDITNGVHAPFKTQRNTQELIKVAAYSRGGSVTAKAFSDCQAEYSRLSDNEMIETSRAYLKKLSDLN